MTQPYEYETCRSIVEQSDVDTEAATELLSACHEGVMSSGIGDGWNFLFGALIGLGVGYLGGGRS